MRAGRSKQYQRSYQFLSILLSRIADEQKLNPEVLLEIVADQGENGKQVSKLIDKSREYH